MFPLGSQLCDPKGYHAVGSPDISVCQIVLGLITTTPSSPAITRRCDQFCTDDF